MSGNDGGDDRAWLAIGRAQLSARELSCLLERFGDARAIVKLRDGDLREAGVGDASRRALRHPDETAIEADLAWLAQDGCAIVHRQSADFPPLLSGLADPPAVLYVRGDAGALHLPSLAVVGSRNPTRGGVQNAVAFSGHLAAMGFCIVSGLAQGIDTAAHVGALDAGGTTVAVLGHGIDRVYPPGNRELAHRIAGHGALVTEYPPGTPPRRAHFPRRNRLISGLAVGTLVVEAARQSGSLISARLAAEQGREVFAIPGSIHNALSRGCHALIRHGAKLVESADDIIDELGPLIGHLMQNAAAAPASEAARQRDTEYDALLELIGHDPVTADALAAASGLTIEQVSSMLLILELEGEIEALKGGQYSKTVRENRESLQG